MLPSHLHNQLSAFFFKTFIIAKRKKLKHLGLLVIFQLCLLAAFIVLRCLKIVDNPLSNPSQGVTRDSYCYCGNLCIPNMYLLICEDYSPENLELKERIKAVAGGLVLYLDSIEREHDLDNFYSQFMEAQMDKSDYHIEIPNEDGNIRRITKIKGAIIIKPLSHDSQGRPVHNITLQQKCFYNFWIKRILWNMDSHAEILALLTQAFGESSDGNFSLIFHERLAGYFLHRSVLINYSIALCSTLCILFTLGLFVNLCIDEKEEKILMLMRLNGLTFLGYFFAQWICFVLMQSFALATAFACYFLNPLLEFCAHHLLVIPCYLLTVSHVACFAIILSMFFKRSMVALAISTLLVIIGLLGFGPMAYLLDIWQTSFLPIFGCPIVAAKLSVISGRSFLEVLFLKEIWTSLLAGVLWNFGMYFISSYLYNVKEQGYSGTLKPWHYPITNLINARKEKEIAAKIVIERLPDESTVAMDSDVGKMSGMINSNYDEVVKSHLLVYKNIKKVYKGSKLAIEDVSIALKGNQIFGLLGPNGAGKTTLMHITAGLYEATSGTVVLEGNDSLANRQEYLSKIGFCPQHDVYWKVLTVSEHLRFFEILRGSDSKEMDQRVSKTLEAVKLTKYADTMASKISGGERRRMSLAMALSGDSKVVLLDEPTTGLDPKVRRMVWDIISESRHGRLVILTTHSMEEAELLSEIITIMSHGRLRCLGAPNHLKQKFGGQIFVNFENENGRFQDAIQGIKKCCPEGTEVIIVSEGLGSISGRLRFLGDKKESLALMRGLLDRKQSNGIKSFGIVQSSLEDVFMNLVRSSDADA